MDSSKKTYKSHIQLSKVLLRPYQERNSGDITYFVNYLDLKDLSLHRNKLNEIDCNEGNYFDENVEDFLGKEIEGKVRLVFDKVKNIINKKEVSSPKFTANDMDFIRSFFMYSFIRNKDFFTTLKAHSTFAPLIKNFSHSIIFGFTDSIEKFFFKKQIGFISNKTNINFVCPHNLIYYVFVENLKTYCLVIPINKELAVFIDLEHESNQINVIEVLNCEHIRSLNYAAYLTERNHSNSFIVGKAKDLENLLFDINNTTSNDLVIINFIK